MTLGLAPSPLNDLKLVAGSTELVLSNGTAWVGPGFYVPRTASTTVDEIRSTGRDGARIANVSRNNVVETIELQVYGGSPGGTRDFIRSLETMCERAERYQTTGRGDPVYLHFRPAGLRWHRSEVLSGSVAWDALSMRGLDKSRASVALAITRVPWYEEIALRTLLLTNRYGTAQSVLQVDNHDDGSHDNWVQTAAVLGSLETPLYLSFQNTAGSTINLRELFVGIYAGDSPSTFDPTLQGESVTSGGSSTANGNSSNGFYRQWTLTTTKTRIGYWTLASALANALLGGEVQAVTRFGAAPDTTKEPRLQYWLEADNASNFPLWQTPEVGLTSNQLQALGSLPIPPGLPGLADDTQLYLSIWAYAAASTTLAIDFNQLMPTDSFRVYRLGVGGIVDDGFLIDDCGRRAYLDFTSIKYQLITTEGGPLMLQPGQQHKVFFLHNQTAGAMDISPTADVRLSYRPRHRTL